MSNLTPQVLGPDGTLRTQLIFSTTQNARFFSGTIDANTVDMEVSINGAAYTNDPDFLVFEGTSWVLPNPAVYPDGLELLAGSNTLSIRAVGLSGTVSSPAEVTVTVVQESDIGIVATSPTNISVEQKDNTVVIQVEGLTNTGFQGLNVYASQYEGGGSTGYQRVNLDLVTDSTTVEDVLSLASLEADSTIATTGGGDPVADPLYFRVSGQQEDADEQTIQVDFDERFEIPETTTALRTSLQVNSVRTYQQYSFEHGRSNGPTSTPATISINAFAATPADEVLYYVVTAVFFDSVNNIEFESAFSQEVVGKPTRVTATIGTFPVVSRSKIIRDYITAVGRSNPQVRVEEGAPLRDVVIDPFSTEAERIRFILDFLHRSRSPTQLLVIDDPEGTGSSSDVSTNAYKLALKQAFRLQRNADVQALIDSAFEAYASNLGVFRRAGRTSQGQVTFFTRTRPTKTVQIPLGTSVSGGGRTFRTTQAASIPLNQLASFFNPTTGRYQVTVPVRAVAVGSSGNVGAGQIRRVDSNIATLSVTNSAAMFGGADLESNLTLTERARNRLSSVDTGTKQGYLQTAADVPGVLKANVVGAGDNLMQRDLDSSGVHRGGKVDIWIQGTNLATVTDTFSFTFEIAQDIQFEIIGDPTNLEFVALDPGLSEDNPIVEMLDFPDAGYQFRNVSTGLVFDLTGVSLTSYNTIKLDTNIFQPGVSLTNVVLGSYRRRVGNEFIFPRQPVSEVVTVEGVVSGQLPDSSISLFRPDPPLEKGRSSLAENFLTITSYVDSNGDTVPSGELIAVTNEAHVLLGEYPEFVDNLGAVFLTVRVFSTDRSVEYRGPNDPSGESDYTIILGDQTTPLAIKRVEGGAISSGGSVVIDYNHDENFTVTYRTNLIVSTTQNAVEAMRHATADVIVKDAVPVPLDIEATVVLNKGKSQEDVDPNLRTNLENFITNLRLGDPIRQSDVVNIIENTSGVSYVTLPLAKMVRGEGSQVVRERLTTDLVADVVSLPDISSASVLVWLIEEALEAATTNGGGSVNDFRGVFQDDVEMALLSGSANITAMGIAVGRAFIIGTDGLSIPGYSDDATLEAAGFTTTAAKSAQRILLTANRVLVSTATSDSPVNHTYSTTYIVGEDSGAKDVDPSQAAYITVGNFLFTYDEDQGQ